jgi:hypothetical protein
VHEKEEKNGNSLNPKPSTQKALYQESIWFHFDIQGDHNDWTLAKTSANSSIDEPLMIFQNNQLI